MFLIEFTRTKQKAFLFHCSLNKALGDDTPNGKTFNIKVIMPLLNNSSSEIGEITMKKFAT